MSVPVLRQEQTPQVWMVVEGHAEEVVSLALHPVGRGPDGGDALYPGLARVGLDAHAHVLRDRVEVIDDLERRLLALGPVDAGQVGEVVKGRLRVVAQSLT